MKRWMLASVLVLVGCQKQEEVPPPKAGNPQATNASSGSAVTAPVDYLNSITKAKKASEKTIDTVAINAAIAQFNIQEGRNPKDLNELVAKNYLKSLPTPPYGTKMEYDAAEGKVKIVPQ